MHCLYPLQSSSDAIERRIIPLLVGRGIPFRGPILFWGMPPGDARRRRRSGRVTFPTPSPQNAHSQHIPSATSSVILSASKRKDPLLTLASAYPIKQSRCHIGTASPPPCGPAELPSPRAGALSTAHRPRKARDDPRNAGEVPSRRLRIRHRDAAQIDEQKSANKNCAAA